jgi:subtilase family serine protease
MMISRSNRQVRSRARVGAISESLEVRALLSAVTPAQVRHAYGFDQINFRSSSGALVAGNGAGQTIAIVDAYDDPNISADLSTFDSQWGISNADSKGALALTKVAPQGTPAADAGWSQEIALDVEWAHAIAPGAHILLVEAKDSSTGSLLGAVDYARHQAGVTTVSMSWGSPEWSGETAYDSYFTTPAGHANITFVASSGDNGAPSGWPAVSPNVVAVGGTTLTINPDNTYGGESGWSGSGGGVSNYETEPSYQRSLQSTGRRTAPDLAYNADPTTGFYVYDSVAINGSSGWWQVGGTSAGAPQIAAMVAIADQGRSLNGLASLDGAKQVLPAIYSLSSSDFHDVTTGSNGYSAGAGYDLVTGRGSPVANRLVPDLVAVGATKTTTTTTTTTTASAPRTTYIIWFFSDGAKHATDVGAGNVALAGATGATGSWSQTHILDDSNDDALAGHVGEVGAALLKNLNVGAGKHHARHAVAA